jgi:hypothetical protein
VEIFPLMSMGEGGEPSQACADCEQGPYWFEKKFVFKSLLSYKRYIS